MISSEIQTASNGKPQFSSPLCSHRQGPLARQSSSSTRSSGFNHSPTATAFTWEQRWRTLFLEFSKQIRINKHAVKLEENLSGIMFEYLFTNKSSRLLSVYYVASTVTSIYMHLLISFSPQYFDVDTSITLILQTRKCKYRQVHPLTQGSKILCGWPRERAQAEVYFQSTPSGVSHGAEVENYFNEPEQRSCDTTTT